MPRRLHRVEFSWFETKTYPIATHLDARSTWNLSRRTKATRPRAEHHSKFKSRDRRWLLGSIGWGEPKAKRKHCTRTPFVRFFFFAVACLVHYCFGKGKLRVYPLFSKPRGARSHRHEHTASDHEYLHDITLADAIAFHVATRVRAWLLWCERVCVCVSNRIESAASVMKIFNFKMATDVFSQLVCLGFSGDGNTFHGDACGKVWLPSTLDCTFEKFYIYRDRQFVPYSKKNQEGSF